MTEPTISQKPVSEIWRPELTLLPRLTLGRRLFRRLMGVLFRFVFFFFSRATVSGLENYPKKGPALIVLNHLGDVDALLLLAYVRVFPEALAKIELYDIPFLGKLMHTFGVIWLHRGRPDRRALTKALLGLREGRLVAIAPEGRESLTGRLEQGTDGAAFLAIKGDVPILPVTFTGTGNARIYGNLRKLKRTSVSMKIGKPFRLPENIRRCEATRIIMETLASQLPYELRGVYDYIK